MARKLAGLIILAALSVLLYARTTGYPFVFDDVHVISKNPAINDISKIPKLFTGPNMEGPSDKSGSYRPLLYSTYALNYRMDRLNPAPYHWTGILLHIINSFLVFLIIQEFAMRAGRDPWPWSLLAAGVFCLHPVQTEAVIYTSARSVLMATLFCSAALLLYFKYRTTGRPAWLLLAVLSHALGLLSKENALAFLPLFILAEAWLYGYTQKRKYSFKSVAPFAALSLSFFALRLYQMKGSTAALPKWGFVAHWLTETSLLPRYVMLLILPFGLSVDHDVPIVINPLNLHLLAGAAILAASAYIAYRFYRTNRLITLLVAWPFLSISTEMVFPLPDLMVEYRLYPALAGLVSLAAYSAARIKGRKPARIGLALAMCLLVFLGALSLDREAAWSSEVALWRDAAVKSPNLPRPYNNLGNSLNLQGDYQDAEGYILRALELSPDYVEAYVSLGRAYEGLKQYGMADAAYAKAIELAPDWPKSYIDYGAFLGKRGEYARAEQVLKNALEIDPASDEAYTDLGNVYACTGKVEDSLIMYQKALELNPVKFVALVNMGISLTMLGRYDEAFDLLSKAARLYPGRKSDMAQSIEILKGRGQTELAARLERIIGDSGR